MKAWLSNLWVYGMLQGPKINTVSICYRKGGELEVTLKINFF